MDRPSKDICLKMAKYQHGCMNEEFMWRWLFEWATWEDDMQCHVERRKIKQRRSVMDKEQIERFNQTFPEFDNILGRTMVAWVEAEVTQKLVEQFDEIFEDTK
jgi:hypothetical protein